MIKISSSWPSTCSRAQRLHHFGFLWGWGLLLGFLQCMGHSFNAWVSHQESVWVHHGGIKSSNLLEISFVPTVIIWKTRFWKCMQAEQMTMIKMKLVGTLKTFSVNHTTWLLSYHIELSWENLCCCARISVFAILNFSTFMSDQT